MGHAECALQQVVWEQVTDLHFGDASKLAVKGHEGAVGVVVRLHTCSLHVLQYLVGSNRIL